MKKFLAMILAAMMLLALAAPLAADTGSGAVTTGTITIKNAKEGVVYKIYRILDLHSYDPIEKTYAYKTNETWEDFILGYTVDGKNMFEWPTDKDGNDVLDSDGQRFVWWNGLVDQSADNVAAFAQAAIDEATTQVGEPAADKIGFTARKEAPENGELVFDGLPLGYYLISTSLGSICSLDTMQPNATVYEKNAVPSIMKEVQEDSKKDTAKEWGETNDADIGQMVKFRSTIDVVADKSNGPDNAGWVNYMMHDKLSAGLTFVIDEDYPLDIKIKRRTSATDTTTVPEVLATLKFDYTPDPDENGSTDDSSPINFIKATIDKKTVDVGILVEKKDTEQYNSIGCTEECTFFIKFNNDFIRSCGLYDQIIVEYYAELNENAVIGTPGNPNDVWLTYGKENTKSPVSTTITYTYGFELLKYHLVEGVKVPLDGAEFELYYKGGTEKIKFVRDDAATAETDDVVYRVAASTDAPVGTETDTRVTTIPAGRVKIVGLDVENSYTLKEIKAPAGYNKLTLDTAVEVTAAMNTIVEETTGEGESKVVTYKNGVQIENKKGSILPSTGGIGTTIFYIVGGLMMAAAVVLLVTKRKMAAEDNE